MITAMKTNILCWKFNNKNQKKLLLNKYYILNLCVFFEKQLFLSFDFLHFAFNRN